MVRFKALVPKLINEGVFAQAAKLLADDAEKDFRQYFEGTTNGWEHGVKWVVVKRASGSEMKVAFGTNDEIYGYVSQGTRPHAIHARSAGALAFQTGYSASTQPGSLQSKRNSRSGGLVFARAVQHPGTTARKFPDLIVKAYRPRFAQRARERFADAARRSQGG